MSLCCIAILQELEFRENRIEIDFFGNSANMVGRIFSVSPRPGWTATL